MMLVEMIKSHEGSLFQMLPSVHRDVCVCIQKLFILVKRLEVRWSTMSLRMDRSFVFIV